MKQLKRNALLVGAVIALFAFMAMNVAAQDDKMMGDKMGSQMMMDKSKPTVAIIRADWCEACQKLEPGIKDFGIRYPVARDVDASVARCYQVTATPTVIFLDAQGVVTYRGNRLPEDYDRRLGRLLKQGGHK